MSAGGHGNPPGTSATEQTAAEQNRIKQTQAQVDEVVDIMKDNVAKVMERGEKLSELDDRAAALEQGACQFEQSAVKLKRKYWFKNKKMAIIGGIVMFVLLIILGSSVFF